jgi:hypothetical protein
MNIPEHIDPRNGIDGICHFGIGWVYLGGGLCGVYLNYISLNQPKKQI